MELHGEQVDSHSRVVFTEPETNNQHWLEWAVHSSILNVAHRSAGEMWNSARTFYKVIV